MRVPAKSGRASGEFLIWKECVSEATRFLDWALSVAAIDSEKIAVVGKNLGGTLAGMWMSEEKRIKCLVATGTVPALISFWKKSEHPAAVDMRESEGYDAQEFEGTLGRYELSRILKKSDSVPTLLQFGNQDDWVSPAQVQETGLGAYHHVQTQWMDDDHAMNLAGSVQARLSWVKETLAPKTV